MPSFAAQVAYPEGVTEQTAEESIEKTDALIKNVLKAYKNATLSQIVMPMLYSDSTLSAILVNIYQSFGEQENTLSVIGVDVSTKNVAAALSGYPSVSQAVAAASDWQSVDLSLAEWNVSDNNGFKNAVSSMFSPLNELIYVLLCSGSYRRGFITIKGDNGYQNGVVPILDALGCTSILSDSQFKADADADKSTMIKNIIDSVLSMLDSVLASPAVKLCEIAPNLAYFMNEGGMDECINALINPLKIGIGNYITLFTGSALSSLIGGEGEETADANSTVSAAISSFTSSGDMKLAELDTELLASCGTVENGKVVSDKGEAYVVLFSWLIETAKLNKDSLSSELAGEEAEQMKPIIDNLFSKSTDEILALLVELLTKQQGTDTEYQWAAPQFAAGSVTYTPNLGREKYQRVVEGIDDTLGEFIAESGEYKNISQAVKAQLFSSGTVTALASQLYGQLSSGEMKDAAKMLSVPSSPSAFAAVLGSDYYSAKAALSKYSSWENVSEANINWGFKAGDEKGFEKALVAVLSPLESMLNMLLRGGKIELFGAISFCGTSGYNTAVIPLLEALGCPSESIKTYAEFKADTSNNACVKNLVTPIMGLLNKIAEKPIYTLTEILPNMIFFIQSGGLSQCIDNLLVPVTDLLNRLSISPEQLGLDKIKNIDILSEISDMIPEMMKDSMTLPKPDLSKLGNLGQLEVISSKRTYQGNACQAYYVKADQPAVMVTLLRYFVSGMKDPENADFLTGMMAGNSSDGGNNMFETYSSNIGSEMEEMTVDETIEWLYKLFFRERAVSKTAGNDDYTPTIIYVESKKSVVGKVIMSIVLILLLAAVVVCIVKREVIFDRLEERRQKKLKKKHEAEIEQYRLEIRRRYLEEQEKLKAQQAQAAQNGEGGNPEAVPAANMMFMPQQDFAPEAVEPNGNPQTDGYAEAVNPQDNPQPNVNPDTNEEV
ncbi:MAG: hypothetical protein ACI4SB_08180 [Acutalibacteraceae bacterium]